MKQNGLIASSLFCSKRCLKCCWWVTTLLNRRGSASQTWPLSLALSVPAILPCAMLICYLPKQTFQSPPPASLKCLLMFCLPCCSLSLALRKHSTEITETHDDLSIIEKLLMMKGQHGSGSRHDTKTSNKSKDSVNVWPYLHRELSSTLVESAW